MAKKKNEVRKSPFLYRKGQEVTYTKSAFTVAKRGETIDGVIKDRWALSCNCGNGLTVVVNMYLVHSSQLIFGRMTHVTSVFNEHELKRRVVGAVAAERKAA